MKALIEKFRRALRAAWEFVRTLGVLRLVAPTAKKPAPAPGDATEDIDIDDDDIGGDGAAPLSIGDYRPIVTAS